MITELSNFVTLSKNLISALKEFKALLPNPEDRNRLDEKIESAERELALSEATAAKDLGYELCQCTFPPQIMLFTGKKQYQYQCPRCHFIVDKSTTMTFSD
ncbi:MAG: hypothetical protein ACXV74_11275 [Methylobacter sp.]